MIVAIASRGNKEEAKLDSSFGRCQYFALYNTDSKLIDFIPNPYKGAEENAGSNSVELLYSKNITKIISGEFGLKIKPLLDRMKIQMIKIINTEKTIKQIIDLLNH